MTQAKSAEIHTLYGDPSNLGNTEERDVKPAPIVPDPPNWLSRRGRGIWKELSVELEKSALLTRRDQIAFGTLCEEAVICIEALLLLRDDKNGYGKLLDYDRAHAGRARRNPAWIIYTQAKKTFQESAKNFGLDPRSRIGLMIGGGVLPPVAGAGEDDDEAVFGGY